MYNNLKARCEEWLERVRVFVQDHPRVVISLAIFSAVVSLFFFIANITYQFAPPPSSRQQEEYLHRLEEALSHYDSNQDAIAEREATEIAQYREKKGLLAPIQQLSDEEKQATYTAQNYEARFAAIPESVSDKQLERYRNNPEIVIKKIRAQLPYITNTFIITEQYGVFVGRITKSPYSENRRKARQWILDQGVQDIAVIQLKWEDKTGEGKPDEWETEPYES